MQKINTAVFTVVVMLLGVPSVTTASSWICEHDNLIREINVQRETAGAAPCSVVYDKDSEGQGTSVLWTATSDGTYCDTKADGLAEKLQGYGWTCTAH